jgi:hypothetical protein
MSRTDRVVPVVATVVVVAALVLGFGALRSLSGTDDPTPPTTAPAAASSPSEATTDLDAGATTADDVTACLTPDFATDSSQVTVLYGVQQHRLGGQVPVLVLRNAAGDLRLCDQFGGDSPSQAPVPAASSSRPVAFLSTGHSDWACAGTSRVLDRFQKSTWLVVSPDVATVEQRLWVDDVPGPWFTTRAQHGYAHLQAWLKGPEPAGTKYAEQFRVLDASGGAVRQTSLPTRRSVLPGCSAGGSAQIG